MIFPLKTTSFSWSYYCIVTETACHNISQGVQSRVRRVMSCLRVGSTARTTLAWGRAAALLQKRWRAIVTQEITSAELEGFC